MHTSDAQYREFLRGIRPYVLALEDCRAELDRQRFMAVAQSPEQRTLIADYRVESIEGDSSFNIIGKFSIVLQSPQAVSTPHLTITCSFYGHFHGSQHVNEANVSRFANAEARLMFMPYVRQFVSDLTGRMWIPPVMVPLALLDGTPDTKTATPAEPGDKGKRTKTKRTKSPKS